jgi:iron complex outermembrane receptor protein
LIIGSKGLNSTNTNESEEVFIPDASINELSAFSISTWETEKVIMQAGVRFDTRAIELSDWTGSYSYPSFSFGTRFLPNKSSEIRANYSKGNRAPGLSELVADGIHHGANRYEIGNKMLGEERSNNFDLGFSHRTSTVDVDVAIFRNSIRDYIFLSPTGNELLGFNVYEFKSTDAVLKGGEIGLTFSPQLFPEISFVGSASYVRGQSVDDNLPWMPPLNFHSEFNWEKSHIRGLKSVFASVSADFTTATDHVSMGETSSSAYNVVNVIVGAKVFHHFSVSIAASNLFNTTYIPHLSLIKDLGIPEAGRNINARLSFEF